MDISNNMYDAGTDFVSSNTTDKFVTLGFENYYDVLKEKDELKLLDLHTSLPVVTFKKLVNKINSLGTISPNGPIIDTPAKITVELKPHQKRTLYEMLQKENSKYRYSAGWNVNLLCDDVGSGKSLCILSLIGHRPLATTKTDLYYSSKRHRNVPGNQWYGNTYDLQYTLGVSPDAIELESNLIVVPHNIFLQWKEYITKYTKIKTFFIKGKKDYTKFCESKESVLKYCKTNDIILIKSTMYKKFYSQLNRALLDATVYPTEYAVAKESIEKISNITKNNDPSIHMKYKVRQIKTDMYKNYTDFLAIETNTVDGEKQELKKRFETLISNLKNVVENYNWKDIGKNDYKKITPYKNNIKTYYFQRVIVDEVDSIKIPAFPYIYSKQTWYITSSINNIIYPYGNKQYNHETGLYNVISSGIPGTGFLKEILANIFRSTSWGNHNIRLDTFRGLFCIVRNNNKFIQHSIHIPTPIINIIKCYTPPHLYAIKNAIDKDALKAFNAGDTKKAIEILGCKGGTEEDLIKQITEKLETKREELENKIKNKTIAIKEGNIKVINLKQHLDNPECDAFALSLFDAELEGTKKQIKNNKSTIKLAKDQIKSLDAKINGIKERLADIESKQCPICYCPFVEPSITPCCNNVFCIECITMSISSSPSKECPLCRAKIDLKDVNLIINDTVAEPSVDEKENKLLSKTENLLKLIKEKPGKRVMIFSEYDASLNLIRTELDKLNINHSGIKGASSTIQNIITKFKEREFNVLLLNAKYFGAGLNLQFTDEIIIYHRMSKDLETQVIGRAQRLGRTESLKINYLCYDNEYSE